MSEIKHEENTLAGAVGAFLLSLCGGLICFLVYQIGLITSLTGLITVILACKGYEWFAKKESIRGVIISSIIALLVIVLSWYLCIAMDIFQAYKDWFAAGEVDFTLSFFESCKSVTYYLSLEEVRSAYIKDLILMLLFAILGSVFYIINTIKRIKNSSSTTNSAQVDNAATDGSSAAVDTEPLRVAGYQEKEKVYLKAESNGHNIIYRKYGKGCEELIVDGNVYGEFLFKGIAQPHTITATVYGMAIEVGYFQVNFIRVNGQQLAKSTRWI